MISAEYDLRYLRAGLDILEDYLKSDELYWSIGAQAPAGTPPYPQLTLGAMLLARERASARVISPAEQTELAQVSGRLDGIERKWRAAWEKKAGHEYRSRLTLWGNFLEDYRENRAANFDRYAYEVRRRVQLHLLDASARDLPPAEVGLLAKLDLILKAVWMPGDFIWSSELASAFPQPTYWYLYGHLPAD